MSIHELRLLPLACILGLALDVTSRPALAAPEAQQAADDAAVSEKRIFVYDDGRVVRGVARAVGNGYEVAQGGSWRALDSTGLRSARSESEVFAELRSRTAGAPKTDLGKRTTLATWLMSAGLVDEALVEFDRILALRPNFAPAIETLASAESKLAWPARAATGAAERAACIRRGATSTSRAEREIVAARLARESAGPDLRSVLERELAADLVASVITRRTFAAQALGRIFPGTNGPELLRRAVLDPSADVRKDAARALANVKDAAVTIPISRCLASRSLLVRCHAADALGEMGYAEAVPELIGCVLAIAARSPGSAASTTTSVAGGGGSRPPRAHIAITGQTAYVQDFNVEIAQGASIADPIIGVQNHGAILDVRVVGLSQMDGADEMRRNGNALRRLTGARVSDDPQRWAKWWDENRVRYEQPKPVPDATTGPR